MKVVVPAVSVPVQVSVREPATLRSSSEGVTPTVGGAEGSVNGERCRVRISKGHRRVYIAYNCID